mgnify:CR=1 FL=1|jgi:hypothetical protein
MGKYYNDKVVEQCDKLSKFVIDLFVDKYEKQTSNTFDSDEFESQCFEKAKELDMNLNSLEFNGEFIGFESEQEWQNSNKSFWFLYQDYTICQYTWK